MKTVKFPNKIKIENQKDNVIILGKFESMHLGHKNIINIARDHAKCKDMNTILMMFSEREKNNFYSMEERMMLAQENGKINAFLEFEPTKENFANTYEDFHKYLKSNGVKTVVCGYDFRYGKDREGSVDTLRMDFEVIEIDEFALNGIPVRTTTVRDALLSNKLDLYKELTNHYFFYKGKVVKGLGNGKSFNMPTANIEYPSYKINANEGIYYSYVIYNGRRLPSLTSISDNPTLEADEITYETYIYDFDEDIYGHEIYVELIEKYRDSIKFDSIEELVEQLEEDKKLGEKYFNLR